jgi:transcriptional regulator with XRE-family HTH domain
MTPQHSNTPGTAISDGNLLRRGATVVYGIHAADGPSAAIRAARFSARLTQAALARQAGIDRGTLIRVERGTQVPLSTVLVALLRACGLELHAGPAGMEPTDWKPRGAAVSHPSAKIWVHASCDEWDDESLQ